MPKCSSALVPFECPSAQVPKHLEYPSAQIPLKCPSASSAQVPWVLKWPSSVRLPQVPKFPSVISVLVPKCPSSALSTRVPKCLLGAWSVPVLECLEWLACLGCLSARVPWVPKHSVSWFIMLVQKVNIYFKGSHLKGRSNFATE